jgi:hypothetical protein
MAQQQAPPYGTPAGGGRRAPIGVRGAPTGPRADLSRADTSQVTHNLYVKVVTGADADHKSRDITLGVLKYVHARLPMFARMGLAVKVNKIRSQDLQNPRLVEAMRKRGITRLPALTTPNNVYIGLKEISDIYERNIKEFAAVATRGERPVEGILPEDDLDSFYRDEMTFERADEDAQETGIGEGDDMMDSYRHMMERREKSESSRRPRQAAGGRPTATTSDARAAPPRPASSARPDNVAPPAVRRAPAHMDAEDAEIQETIDRLARDIDDGMRDRAFASGGGDSLDDDGGADPQDDLMERAYWSNQNPSDAL